MLTLNLPYRVKIIETKKEEKPMINFSIIIITKNDEEKLKNILLSFEEFRNNGGEIYILDMGSTDNTINFANEWGCKVEDISNFLRDVNEDTAQIVNDKFKFDENNIINIDDVYFDHSGAKNYASTLISNNMILMIDINSQIINFNFSEIERYINEGYNKFKFVILNKKENIYEFYNKHDYTWYNIIYENLLPNNLENSFELPESILKIQAIRKQQEETLVGLSINSFLDPGNQKISRLFGVELMNKFLYESAINELNRHISICKSNIEISESLVNIGDILIRKGNEKEGLEYYHKSYLECSTRRLALYRLGEYFHFKGEKDKAIFYLEGLLNIPKPNEIDDDDLMYRDAPYSLLYVDYWWIGNPKKGKYYFDKALEINPYNKVYIDESIYHYKYKGNTIHGSLTYQEIQYLYNESKKVKSILEIYPENGRSTHALLNGCDGLVTVILKNDEQQFKETLENPGNLRILNMSITESISLLEYNNEKFDMIVINNYEEIINDYNPYWGILIWEKFANKLICGTNYDEFKNKIDEAFEISGVDNNIWYKNVSTFEKTIIYKRKNE